MSNHDKIILLMKIQIALLIFRLVIRLALIVAVIYLVSKFII